MATKRLKELLEARKTPARDNSGILCEFAVLDKMAFDLKCSTVIPHWHIERVSWWYMEILNYFEYTPVQTIHLGSL